MHETRILELIAKAISGKTSKNEASELNEWLQESDDNRRLYESLKLAYYDTETTLKVDNSDEVFDKILKKAGSPERKSEFSIKRADNKKTTFPWLKVAAAVSLMCISTFLIFRVFNNEQPEKVHAYQVSFVEKHALKGQKIKIKLPDGTVVWLNSDSRIVYPEKFQDSIRRVTLTGEAYFDVTKDPKRPMEIETGDVAITVLGTSFNVNAYPENDKLEISLVSGKIKVSNAIDKSAVLLEEGYAFDYLKKSRESKIREIDKKRLGWKNGILSFEDEPFDSFVEKIERWYGVKVMTAGNAENKDWMLKGEFDNVSLEELMNNVSYGAHFGYEIEEDTLKIFFNSK